MTDKTLNKSRRDAVKLMLGGAVQPGRRLRRPRRRPAPRRCQGRSDRHRPEVRPGHRRLGRLHPVPRQGRGRQGLVHVLDQEGLGPVLGSFDLVRRGLGPAASFWGPSLRAQAPAGPAMAPFVVIPPPDCEIALAARFSPLRCRPPCAPSNAPFVSSRTACPAARHHNGVTPAWHSPLATKPWPRHGHQL